MPAIPKMSAKSRRLVCGMGLWLCLVPGRDCSFAAEAGLPAAQPEASSNNMQTSSAALVPSVNFASVDVGGPSLTGHATPADAGWDVTAGGADIWGKSDQFHFICKEKSGDFDVAIRVESFTPAHAYSKAGIMIRETLAADSPHLLFLVFADNQLRNHNNGGYEMQFRAVAGGDCQAIYPAVKPPAPPEFPATYPHSWLRVKRQGDMFVAYVSTDGKNWRLYAQQDLKLSDPVQVGFALSSHNAQQPAAVGFRDYSEMK